MYMLVCVNSCSAMVDVREVYSDIYEYRCFSYIHLHHEILHHFLKYSLK